MLINFQKESGEKEGNKKFTLKKLLIIILAILFVMFLIVTVLNILNVKQGKLPVFYFAKTINDVDGSVVYNIFPYKITDYKNRANSDSYIEVSIFFKKYRNQFYDPQSSRYIFKTTEYKPPVIDVNKYISLIDDVISKVNTDGFSLGTNSNYSKIYIDTSLDNENKTKLIENTNKEIANKYSNKTILFKSLNSLKSDNVFINGKIIDGIYIKVAILENRETEDIMSMELITNLSTIFSQKVILKNQVPIVFEYSDDFDEQERKRILKETQDNLERNEALKKQEEEKRKKDEEEKQNAEQLRKQEVDDFNKKQNRLKTLLETQNLAIFDGKKGLIKTETFIHLLNEDKDNKEIASYNIIKINNQKVMYLYQEQIEQNASVNIFIKERQLTNEEFNSLINDIKNLTGYTGTGEYQNSFVININYLGTDKNILLSDLNNILKKYDMNI